MSRKELKKSHVKEIIIHCTATYEGKNYTVSDVANWHRQRGWDGIGYHYLIYIDGTVHVGTPEGKVGIHCKGHNNISLGVCYVGGLKNGYDTYTGFDTRNTKQRAALVSLVKQLMQKYNVPKKRVHCHYEFANKACPGFSIESFRKELDGENVPQLSTPFRAGKPSKRKNTTTTTTTTPTAPEQTEVVVVKYKKFKKGWLGGRTTWSVSAPMGNRREPNRTNSTFHNGNDISTPLGTKIYAPCDGTIEKNTQDQTLGLCAILKSKDNDCWFYFGCLSKILKTGSVKVGDLIAETGGDFVNDAKNAGGSTGSHLHFEVRINGEKSKSIDGKFFITDYWINKRTGANVTNANDEIPLITDSIEKQNTENNVEEDETPYILNESEILVANESDVSGETDFTETELEKVVDNDQSLKLEENKLVPGIWQIMKLVIDEDVANLRIRDAATSLQQGSLMNFFQKVCQQPFVEFLGDTFGDQYYFIARRPPFDKEGMKKAMVTQGLFDPTPVEGGESDELKDGKISYKKTIYDIYEDDIVSSNISFNNQNIYSWYQFIPIYELGSPSDLQYLIPAVLFPEYAAIWGSRSLNIRSQYRNFRNSEIVDEVKNGENSKQGDIEVRHSIHDLKYIIESNAYNPFVRQGTINILGNRKIKRGVFIRVFWNSLSYPEVFYVEGVSQNYTVTSNSVNRTTTLSLSHGMLMPYMFDNSNESTQIGHGEKNKKTLSYFNIIDFGDYDKESENIDMDKWREIISKWKVNTDAFLFFLRKTQFLNSLNDLGAVVTGKNINKKQNIL